MLNENVNKYKLRQVRIRSYMAIEFERIMYYADLEKIHLEHKLKLIKICPFFC